MSHLPPSAPLSGDSAAASSGTAERPPRPWSVTLAVALVAATVVALLVSAAVGVEEWLRTSDLVEEAARSTGATPQEVSDEQGIVPAIYVVALALHAVMLMAFVGLSIPVWRGHNIARIALCVVSGLSSLCCGGLLTLAAALPEQPESSAFAEEMKRLEEATSPAWTDIAGILSALFVALVPLAVLTLLLIPPSNRFFRKPAPAGAWQGYQYPGYGYYYGYYGYPAQPGPPGSPPGPPGPPPGPPGPPPVPPA